MKKIIIAFAALFVGISSYANYDCSTAITQLDAQGTYQFVAGEFKSTTNYGFTDSAYFDETPRVSIGVRLFFGYNPHPQASYQIVRFDKDTISWNVEHKSEKFNGDFVTNTRFENYNFMISCTARK